MAVSKSHTFSVLLLCGKVVTSLDRSPGLVVMGEDSCSECLGFESQHCILDGHFSHLFVVKLVMFG